jgi:hypothetical protein
VLIDEDERGSKGSDGAPVQVELQVAGTVLGTVSLAGGGLLSGNSSSAATISLALLENSPLVCIAACARLEVVEQTVVAGNAIGLPRTVTVGECDAHTEHTSHVTLSLLRPASTPPELSQESGGPISCRWQLVLDLAVRSRHDPLTVCSSFSWVYPLCRSALTEPGFADEWHERLAAACCGVAGTVRF